MSLNLQVITKIGLLAVVLVVFAACSPSVKTEFKDFQKDVKASIDPADLQRWAVRITKEHGAGYSIRNRNLPPFIRNIQSYAYPTAMVVARPGVSGLFLDISWGSGFGHWGLDVGDSKLRIQGDSSYLEVIPWTSGVYFFRQTR